MKFDFLELEEQVGKVFFRRHILGGMKGFSFPNDDSDWIIRARYLLTVLDNTHLNDLFELNEIEGYPMGFGASWITALIKDKSYADKTLDLLIKYKHYDFFCLSALGCLLVYDDPDIRNSLTEIKRKYPELKDSFDFFFQRYDELNGKKEQTETDLNNREIPRKYFKIIDNIHKYSRILKANCDTTGNLTASLTDLLTETTPPEKHRLLVFKPLAKASTKEDIFYWQNDIIVSRHNGTLFKKREPQKTNYEPFFTNAVIKFIHIKPLRRYFDLVTALEKSTAYFDILAGIELDTNYMIPAEIIDLAYQKVKNLINTSYQLLEQHAFQLLLRGEKYDEKAQNLYEQAQLIKNKYTIIEEEFGVGNAIYTMKKNQTGE